MGTTNVAKSNWLTIFRTDVDNVEWLYKELTEGRLRQGWGAPGFSLKPRLFMGHVDKGFQPDVFVRSEPGFS